jgi:hypothetical protein
MRFWPSAYNLFGVYSSYELLKQSTTAPADAPRDYNYKLLDTIAINGRMSYMIYFKIKRKVELQDWKAYYI